MTIELTTMAVFSEQDIDRRCLESLRCRNPMDVKMRLKESKGKLLPKAIEWIFEDQRYIAWTFEPHLRLLYITADAGRGKTMMVIGIIERLLSLQSETTGVTFVFCRRAESGVDSVESIVKGLIYTLFSQHVHAREPLRHRWNAVDNQLCHPLQSWRQLWVLFQEMLSSCRYQRLFVVIDALDESDSGDADEFLALLCKTGLDDARVKWLVTSRRLPCLPAVGQNTLDYVKIELDLCQDEMLRAVAAYAKARVDNFHAARMFDTALRAKVESELIQKAASSFLWVSLICDDLQKATMSEVQRKLSDLPPGLECLYSGAFDEILRTQPEIKSECMQLLQMTAMAFRPLNRREVGVMIPALVDEKELLDVLRRCSSFVRMQGDQMELVHESAREFLMRKIFQSPFDGFNECSHWRIVEQSLCCLSNTMKVNLLDLPAASSWQASPATLEDRKRHPTIGKIGYFAVFWPRHLCYVRDIQPQGLDMHQEHVIMGFIQDWLLEWLECLSHLDELSTVIESVRKLSSSSYTAQVRRPLVW